MEHETGQLTGTLHDSLLQLPRLPPWPRLAILVQMLQQFVQSPAPARPLSNVREAALLELRRVVRGSHLVKVAEPGGAGSLENRLEARRVGRS